MSMSTDTDSSSKEETKVQPSWLKIAASIGSIIFIPMLTSDYWLPYIYIFNPSIKITPTFNSIELENHSNGSTKVTRISFAKDGGIYCLNEENLAKIAGLDYLKYKIDNSVITNNIELGQEGRIKIISCDLCKESDYELLLDEIKINIEYKGSGLLNKKTQLCYGKTNCSKDDFSNTNGSC